MTSLVPHMIEMGLLVSIVPPVIILPTRDRWSYRGLNWPAPAAMLFFQAVHAGIVLVMSRWEPPVVLHALLHVVLVVAAVIFWLPVIGRRRRLDEGMRCVYLFLACPTLDLPAVWIVAWTGGAAGLAMIVAMLPIGLAAVHLTWRWIHEEEAAAQLAQQAEPAAAGSVSAPAVIPSQ